MRNEALLLSLLLALALVLPTRRAAAEESVDPERAFVEVATEGRAFYVHQPIRLRWRVGFDAAYFEAYGVPLFRQAMDVPLQVHAPGWRDVPSGVATDETVVSTADADADAGETLSFALEDRVVRALRVEDLVRDGRSFRVLELTKTVRVDAPGDVRIAAPRLRYAHASRFEEDFLGTRIPLDRRDVEVRGRELVLEVRALPEAGRPEGFVDAVGRFAVRAELEEGAGEEGDLLRLRLVVEGEGNVNSLTPPGAGLRAGFHVYGVLDDASAPARTLVFDLAPLSDEVREVPAIRLAAFDPYTSPPGYRVLATEPIPLPGRAGAAGPALSVGGQVANGEDPASGGSRTLLLLLGVGLLLAVVPALWLWRRERHRAEAPADHDSERAQAATAALRASLATPDAALGHALAEYLAAHLRRPAASVIAPDLPVRLVGVGVPVELAARTAETLERLVASRYGGGGFVNAAERTRTLVDDLEAAFHPVEGRSAG